MYVLTCWTTQMWFGSCPVPTACWLQVLLCDIPDVGSEGNRYEYGIA
jgi:hypothetical protein